MLRNTLFSQHIVRCICICLKNVVFRLCRIHHVSNITVISHNSTLLVCRSFTSRRRPVRINKSIMLVIIK